MAIEQLELETGLNKVDYAIKLLRDFEPPEGYYLGFSGGKDSIVLYDIALKSGVNFDSHYCVSPIDPPEIYKFIRENYPDVQWDYHAKGFWKLVVKNDLPTRTHRWCCRLIKESGGDNRFVITGIRSAESTRRKSYSYINTIIKSSSNKTIMLYPILNFDDYDVWQYIRENNLSYCSLYDEGFDRIGCILCPFSRNIARDINRFPQVVKLWRSACEKIIEKWEIKDSKSKYRGMTADELFNWWVNAR